MNTPSGYRRTLVGMVAALCILGAACAGGDNDQKASTTPTTTSPDSSAQRFRLAMVVHKDEPTIVNFWNEVALGAVEAAEQVDVDVEIRGDDDPEVQARIVETMIPADGIGPPNDSDDYYFAVRELFPHISTEDDVLGRLAGLVMKMLVLRMEGKSQRTIAEGMTP